MIQWLQDLEQRERQALAAGVCVLALVLLGLVVIGPMQQQQADARDRIAQLERNQSIVVTTAHRIRELEAMGATGNPNTDEPVYLLIDGAMRDADIQAAERLEPAGTAGARVEWRSIRYDQLMMLLLTLEERHGLSIERARLMQTESGRVDALVELTQQRKDNS